MNAIFHRSHMMLAAALAVAGLGLMLAAPDADAQRRGGGGHAAARAGGGHAGGARASAHTSVNRSAPSRNMQHAGGANVNRANVDRSQVNRDHAANVDRSANRNIDRNTNINRDTNINRNVNVDVHNDYHGDHWNDWDDHPFATAAAVTAGVALTSAVIGSIVYSVPPSCTTVIVNGVSYSQCGNTWYQPQYAGSNVQYIVVNPPQ